MKTKNLIHTLAQAGILTLILSSSAFGNVSKILPSHQIDMDALADMVDQEGLSDSLYEEIDLMYLDEQIDLETYLIIHDVLNTEFSVDEDEDTLCTICKPQD